MNQFENSTAAILVGGRGIRLQPEVSDRPKVLAPVKGRPYLAYLLDQLASAGIRRVVLCTGYMGDMVEKEIGSRYGALEVVYSFEQEALGTAGAIRLALPHFASSPVLVLNGDSFCDADLAGLWEKHQEKRADGTLLLARVSDCSRFGRVRIDDGGKILAFEEKQKGSGPGWINAGIYLLEQRLIDAIPEGKAVSLEREMFSAWSRGKLFGERSAGWFLDIGTPESYARAEEFFALRKGSRAQEGAVR